MIAKICPKTNKITTEFYCKNCKTRLCENENRKPRENSLVSIVEEKIQNEWKNHTFEDCLFCVFKRIMETSHCDVKIYKCMNENSKRYLEDIDDFHIQQRACKVFVPKRKEEKNNE